jgi:hypothetical protein
MKMIGKITSIGQNQRHEGIMEVEINGLPFFANKISNLQRGDLIEYSKKGLVTIHHDPLMFADLVKIEKVIKQEQPKTASKVVVATWLSSNFIPKPGMRIEIDGSKYEWVEIIKVRKYTNYWRAEAKTPDGEYVLLNSKRFERYTIVKEPGNIKNLEKPNQDPMAWAPDLGGGEDVMKIRSSKILKSRIIKNNNVSVCLAFADLKQLLEEKARKHGFKDFSSILDKQIREIVEDEAQKAYRDQGSLF